MLVRKKPLVLLCAGVLCAGSAANAVAQEQEDFEGSDLQWITPGDSGPAAAEIDVVDGKSSFRLSSSLNLPVDFENTGDFSGSQFANPQFTTLYLTDGTQKDAYRAGGRTTNDPEYGTQISSYYAEFVDLGFTDGGEEGGTYTGAVPRALCQTYTLQLQLKEPGQPRANKNKQFCWKFDADPVQGVVVDGVGTLTLSSMLTPTGRNGVDPTEPTDPSDTDNPDPTEPTDPSDTDNPDPTEPTDPSDTDKPEPSEPADPSDTDKPKPSDTDKPKPSDTDKPKPSGTDKPNKPSNTDKPRPSGTNKPTNATKPPTGKPLPTNTTRQPVRSVPSGSVF